MSNKLVKRVAVALLSASMLLSSTGITSLAVTQSDVAAKASSDASSVSVSDDTAKVTKSGGSLTNNAPKMSVSGGKVSTQDAGYDQWQSGTGTQADPYTVWSVEDFLGIQSIVNDSTRSDKYFKLMADINLSSVTTFSTASSDYSGISGVLISASKSRIAAAGSSASNIFFHIDGNGKKLLNFTESNSSSMTAAIFGYINPSSTITNLTVSGGRVTTTYTNAFNSAVFAIQNEGTISNCTFNENVVSIGAPSATTDYQSILGYPIYRGTAIIAGDNAGTIENCAVSSSRVEFEGNARYVGIVAGQNRGTIRNVSLGGIKVAKKAEAATDAAKYVGGIAGSNTGSSSLITGCQVDLAGADPDHPVINNIAYGDVVGGAVGRNAGSVVNTVIKGSFTVDDTITRSAFNMYGSHIFGGVVGENMASGTVTSSSAIDIGAFIENDDVTRTVFGFGGIIGKNSGSIVGCVATGNVVDPGTASTYMTAGGLVGQATSTTTGTLSNSFAFVSLPQSHADIGALIGRGGAPALITNCYFDATVAGRSFPCESYADAFNGDISSETKAIVLNGGSSIVSKADLTPAISSVNSYILPAFNFTTDTPAAYLESGTSGISLSNSTSSVTLTSNSIGAAGNLLVTSSVTMAANIGSTSGVSFEYKFKVPVLYPSAHTESGYIVISNSEEFNFVKYAPFSKFKLNANITASSSWSPIKFFGVINGNSNTLTVSQPLFTKVFGSRSESLTASNESAWIAGSREYGYIHDMTVILNSSITNTAVFGSCADVTFTDVTFNRAASAEIIATRNTVGAFMNEIKGGAYLYNCFTSVPIRINGTSLSYFGGMAARVTANDLIMDNCGSSSSIFTQTNYAPDILASLIGYLEKNSAYGRVSNCYATGKIEPSQNRCHIVIGQYSSNGGALLNNIWSINDTLQGAKEPIDAQSHQLNNFHMWKFADDFGTVNQQTESSFSIDVPTVNAFSGAVLSDFTITVDEAKVVRGTVSLSAGSITIPLRALRENPDSQVKIVHPKTGLVARLNIISGLAEVNGFIEINNAADLLYMISDYANSKVAGHTDYTVKSFKIMDDIDMSGYTVESILAINPSTGFAVPFTGNFVGDLGANGERYTISNLSITTNTALSNSATGLFAYTSGTESSPVTFENLIFENVTVNGGNYTGALVGNSLGGIKFSNVSLNSAVITAASSDFVGGLVGGSTDSSTTAEFYGISISDLSLTGNDFVGGFAGFLNGTDTDTLTSLSASIVVDKIDLPDPQSDVLNTLSNVTITADGFAGSVFGAVSDIINNSDGMLTDVVVNTSVSDYNYNNISMQISDISLSDSSITTENWVAGGLVGASNAAGYSDDYANGYGSYACNTSITNCQISDTTVAVTTTTITLDYYCSVGLVAGLYGGLVDGVTVSDCSASGSIVGGIVGSKNAVYAGDGSGKTRSGLSINDCTVIGSTTLTIPREMYASDPAAGGILGIARDISYWMMPYISITNCGVGKDVLIRSYNIAGGIGGDLRSNDYQGLTSLTISNCTSFATITNNYGDSSSDSKNYFGGLAGAVIVMNDYFFSVKNCAVSGEIYSSSSSATTKYIGGLVGCENGYDYYGGTGNPLFEDCYVAVQLKNNSSSENNASVADGYVIGYGGNDWVTYINSIIRNIKLSSFDQSTKNLIGYTANGSTDNTRPSLLSNSLCEDINKQCTYSPSAFFSDNAYKLDNTTLSANLGYSFDFTDSTNRRYQGMSTGASSYDYLVFDNSTDTSTGKKSGWVSSNSYVGLVSATETVSGTNYSYALNIIAHRVGVSKIYGEFVSSSILVPGTNDEYFTFNVGIRVTSKYTDVTLQGNGTPTEPYLISNEAELGVLSCSHAVYTLDKYYLVTDDIEITGEMFPIGSTDNPFTGSFNGGGHTISTLDGGNSITVGDAVIVGNAGSTTLGLGLFGFTNGATISNFNMDGFRVEPSSNVSDAVSYAGAVAAYSKDTVFDAISINNAIVSNAYVCGGVVGHAGFTATAANSTIKTVSVLNSSVSASSGSNQNTGVAGGIVAEFSGVIGNATLASNQTEDILVEGCHITSNKSFVGGIIGRNIFNSTAGKINITINNAAVRKAESDPANVYEITGSDARLRSSVGGIIGAVYDTSTSGSVNDICVINHCIVGKGVDIYNQYVSGGIIGYSYLKKGSITIDKCESYANVTSLNNTNGDTRGSAAIVGFVVELPVLHVKNSVAGGKITYNNTGTTGAGGGIFGDFNGSDSVAAVSEPIVYNCIVSAEFVDRQTNSKITNANIVLGEYFSTTNYQSKMDSIFPSSGAYSVRPFENIFFSGYQYPYDSAIRFSKNETLNSSAYINSVVKFVDMNCLGYRESAEEDYDADNTVFLLGVDTSATDNFGFDPTYEFSNYLYDVTSVASFKVKSERNGVSDYHNFRLERVTSNNGNVRYDPLLLTIKATGENPGFMEYVYENGVIVTIKFNAMSDLEMDNQGNYKIMRIAHLGLLKMYPNARFKQYVNLDFSRAELSPSQKAAIIANGGTPTTHDAFSDQLDGDGNPVGDFYNNGSYWDPVNFSGTYDGGNCTITGLVIERSSENVGFFRTLSGTVKNLTLSGAEVHGGEYTGAIAAIVDEGGHIENVCVTDSMTQTLIEGTKYVGGIAGRANSENAAANPESRVPSIENSSVVGCSIINVNDETPDEEVAAGIVAYSAGAYVKDCTVRANTIIGGSWNGNTYSYRTSGIVGVAAEPSRATDTTTDIEGCLVFNGVNIKGKMMATGVFSGILGNQNYANGDNTINITDCIVGSGASNTVSGSSATKIIGIDGSAAGIFSQPTDYNFSISGSAATIKGCKVGSDVDVFGGLAESNGSYISISETYMGYAGGIAGYLGALGSYYNDYTVHILASESYANVYGLTDAAAVLDHFEGKMFDYVLIEACVAGGTVYANDGYACGFIGTCWPEEYDPYEGDGIVIDSIFSAELSAYYGNDYTGMLSNLFGFSDIEGLGVVKKYDEIFKNIYYSSFQTNYDGWNNPNYDANSTPVHAFPSDYYGIASTGYITLIDISVDEELGSVVMVDNAGSGSFSPLALTKYDGTPVSYKRPVQVNLRNVQSIVYETDPNTGDYLTDANTGHPVVTITRSAQATDVGIKQNSFNLSNNPNLNMPIKLTGMEVDFNGASTFTVVFNNIAEDTRHSAQITPRGTNITNLVVEITGGLKIPVKMISADLEGEGTRANPFLVRNSEDLGTASRASGGFFWKQVANLDLSLDPVPNDPDDPDDDFMPIGSERSPFNGGYDGNGFRISNVSFNLPNQHYVGLFGYVIGDAELKNIHIELGSGGIVGNQNVGGLVGGYYSSNPIVNCSVVNGSVEGTAKVGGLAGDMTKGATQCFTSTLVKAIRTIEPIFGCGGIAGRAVYQDITNTVTFDRCFTSGSVVANQSCGALLGSSGGNNAALNITNCFSTADVFYVFGGQSGIPDSYMTSIVGYNVVTSLNNNSIALSNFYFAGTNSRNTSTVRLLPDFAGNGSYTYTNVYYDRAVTGSVISTQASSVSELEKGSTLPTGFSSTVWSAVDNDYPALIMADSYSNVYSRIGAMSLGVNQLEETPNAGYRYSVTIPAAINSANVSVTSSEKGIGDETVAYNSNYDLHLTGNTSAKTSDFLWKTDSGRIALLRNVFGSTSFNGVYATSYENNKALPYITASYTQSCTFEGLTATAGVTPDSTPVSVTASRKIIIPLENNTNTNSYYIATERQLRAITEAIGPDVMGVKMANFHNVGSSTNDRIYIGYDIELNSAVNYTPIPLFTGKLYGGGSTVSGLKIDCSGVDNVGFFAQLRGTATAGDTVVAEVNDLTLSTVGVRGGNNVGALAGFITDTVSISGCYVYAENNSLGNPGTVSGGVRVGGLIGAAANYSNKNDCRIYKCGSYLEVSGDSRVGGLIGMSVLPIEECGASGHVVAAVTAAASNLPSGYSGDIGVGVGGLVGTTTSDITKSYASGDVTVSSLNNSSNVIGVGGLAGVIGSGAMVETIFSSGEVDVDAQSGSTISVANSGTKFGVGGLIGVSDSAVSGCYSSSLVSANIEATVNAINKGVGGLIGVASGLQDAYSSGSVRVNSAYASSAKCGRIIGRTSSTSNSNLYYDSLRTGSDTSVTKNIGDGDLDTKVLGMKTSEFFKTMEDGGHFDTTSRWSVNDGAYPVLKAFFGADVSTRIKNAVALSVVTITYDERDTSAMESGVVTMAFKMPTELEITTSDSNGEYTDRFEFEVEPIEESGLAQVREVAPNTYVPVRTSNDAQDMKFVIFVKNQRQYGTRNVNMTCPEMRGTEDNPYLIATAEDLKHVAMSNAVFTATDSGSHYKYWVAPFTVENGVATIASGKVYYKFISDIDMTDETYHIDDLVDNATGNPVTYSLFGNTVSFSGFDIEGDDFSVNNLSTNTSFIDEVNAGSTIRNLMFDNISLSGLSANNIALIGKNSGELDGIIVRTGSTTNINGTNYVAGLAVENTGTIRNSVADVTIISTTYGGGLVSKNSGTIERCAANAAITAGGDTFGGFAAQNTGTITDSFAMGSVNSSSARNQVGGFVGYNAGNISGAYSTVSVAGCVPGTSGLFAGVNTQNNSIADPEERAETGKISNAYSSGFAGYSGNGSNNMFCGSNSATLTDCYYDLFMAGSNAATSNLENSIATGELYSMNCFSNEAKAKFTATAVGAEGVDANGYPQLKGLLTVINNAKDEDGNLNELKFRVLQGYSEVSTAGIKTAYGQFINTLPVSTVNGVSVNSLTPGINWSGDNSLSFRPIPDFRATAVVTDANVTAAKSVVLNELQNTSLTVSKAFKVSAGAQNPMFAAGNGSSASPYQISTAAQFGNLKYYGPVDDANYVLNANINGSALSPITLFKGTLDGNQKVIYDYSSTNGVFGDIIGGTVENLGLVGADITGSATDAQNNFGMIAATLTNGVLRNVYAIGDLTVDFADPTAEEQPYVNVGGLVGSVYFNSKVENCASSGKVINNCSHTDAAGSDTVGGIAGLVDIGRGDITVQGHIADCMSTAFVSGYGDIGGIAGSVINESILSNVLFAGSAADDGMRSGISVADGAKVGSIVGTATADSVITGAVIDSQTVMVSDANADAKTTKDLVSMTISGWAASNGVSYPNPITVTDSASMFAQGLSAVTLPVYFEYKQAEGSMFSYDTIKVPSATSTSNVVSVDTPDSMIAGTAETGYHVFVPGDDPQGYTTEVVPVITITGVTNTVSRYFEPKLIRLLSLSYDVYTDNSASSINSNTVGVQVKNRYGALNMSSEAFTTALNPSDPHFDDIAVPIVQSGFYVGAKLPKGYEYQVKWKGAESEDELQDATVVENEYGYFVDASGWTDTDNVYFEITIVKASDRWGVFDSWDSIANFAS